MGISPSAPRSMDGDLFTPRRVAGIHSRRFRRGGGGLQVDRFATFVRKDGREIRKEVLIWVFGQL